LLEVGDEDDAGDEPVDERLAALARLLGDDQVNEKEQQ
jgi:hypothetical protein